MRVTKKVGLLAGAAAATFASGVLADSDVSKDELLARLAAAEAKIAELSNVNNDNWMTEQRAAEVRAIVQDVLSDAETRASLLQSGMTGGWDRGFRLRSADGNYALKIDGMLQVRYAFNYRDSDSVDPAVDSRDRRGFSNPNTRLRFSGHVVDPTWQYNIQFDFSGTAVVEDEIVGNGFAQLLDAYIKKICDNGWYVRGGQFKAPFLRETLVDARYQLAADRSLINHLFSVGRSQGLELGFEQDQFRAMVMLHEGSHTTNNNPFMVGNDYGFAGRAEFLAQGNWDQFRDFTSPQGSETGILIGAAFNFERDHRSNPAAMGKFFGFTVDASFEFDGANIYGAFVYSDMDATDSNPWGFVLQGGYYFTEDFELFARYEFGDLDAAGSEDLNLLTIGVNKYIHSHNLKWTTDIGFSFDEIDAEFANLASGYFADPESGQVLFRTQFQLLF